MIIGLLLVILHARELSPQIWCLCVTAVADATTVNLIKMVMPGFSTVLANAKPLAFSRKSMPTLTLSANAP